MYFENEDKMNEIQLLCDALISAVQVQQAGFEMLNGPLVAR